jgi:hypothetical protein
MQLSNVVASERLFYLLIACPMALTAPDLGLSFSCMSGFHDISDARLPGHLRTGNPARLLGASLAFLGLHVGKDVVE